MAAILGLTFLAYFNSLFGEFVYDDAFQILKNPTLQSLANLPAMFTQGVWQFMTANQSGQNEAIGLYYRPMFNSLLIVNYQLFGFAPVGWHVVSLLLHLAVTLLVYLLAKRWQWPRPAAALAALLFGLHPVHVESVAWVSGVPDPLAAVFILSALLAYERSRKNAAQLWLLLSLLCALAALFTKEVAIMLPVLIVLRELLAETADESPAAKLGRAVKRALPFAVAALLYLAARYAVLGFISRTEMKAAGITGAQVFLTLPSVLLAYVRLLFAPYPLAVIYDHNYINSPSDPRCWLAALAVLAIVGASLWLVRHSRLSHSRLEMLALALLVLFLLPVLNLKTFNPEESIIHDRYLYLPSIGLCLLLGLGVNWLRERTVAQKQFVAGAVLVVCVLLFGLTVYQNTTWESEEAMITHALQVSPKRAFLHNLLGANYINHNKLAEAAQSYSQAVSLNPRYYDAFSNLGDVYLKQNKYAEAEQAYAQSVAHGAIYPQTYYNLADVQAKQRKYTEAEQTLQRAVQMKTNYAEAYFYLGWVYQQQNRFEPAATAYQQALNARADYLEPRLNLAYVLSEQGKLKEAEAQLEIAKRRAPTHQVLLYTLGEVYRKSGRLNEAVTTLAQLVNAQPQHQMGQLSLGITYEQIGETAKAKLHLQQAIDIAPQERAAQTAREHLVKLP
jgi:protein O-mannosyl-transferase